MNKILLTSLLSAFAATFAFLPTAFAVDVPPESLVLTNPSFESAKDDGGPAGWSADSKYFTVSSEDARTGNACLKWSGDGREYKLCGLSTKLVPGSTIEYSVWVKTRDLKYGSAAICVEWNRPDGSWYGGSYAQGPNGTNDEWTKIGGRTTIPKDAISPHIECYVTKDGAGTVWFDDVEIARYFPPLFSAATTDRYRNQSIGGNVDVYVGYVATTDAVDFKTLEPKATILDAAGNAVDADAVSLKFVEAGDDYYRFSFDSTPLSLGEYKLSVSMVDPNSNKEETIATPFARLDKFPERVGYIDEHLRLIHNGEPFFPLGLYLGGASAKEIELIGDSPFNCVMPYASLDRPTLDALLKNGIKTIYSVKDNFPGLAVKAPETGDELTAAMVNAVKDHPGVLAWYINDELPATMVDALAARRDQMEKLDPGRPTWVVLYQVDEYRAYLSTFDVAGSDPYPIPTKPASLASEWTRKTIDSAFGKRAVWQVPQIFNWASYKKDGEQSAYRAPTYEEMRGMAWQCVAEGANGLIFYSFFDLERMGESKADGGRAVVPDPFDKRWAEVKKFAAEIADNTPILLSVGETLNVEPTANSSVETICRFFGTDAGTWALVVNKSSEPQTAEFALPEGAKLVETRLGGDTTQTGSTIQVKLDSLEPSLILIR